MSCSIYSRRGVYGIENTQNGKVYVGQTLMNFGDRWDCHRAQLNGNNHYNTELQEDWNKYGSNKFRFFIITECDSQEDADQIERASIAEYRENDLCYNIADGGSGSWLLGKHLSEDAKQKIGEKNRQHMSERILSEETKKNMSLGQKKFWDSVSEEYRKLWGKISSKATSGYQWNEESKQKFSDMQKKLSEWSQIYYK